MGAFLVRVLMEQFVALRSSSCIGAENLEIEAARQISEVYDVTKEDPWLFYEFADLSVRTRCRQCSMYVHVLEYHFSNPRTQNVN